jgi:hypothetical protein
MSLFITEDWRRHHAEHLFGLLHDLLCDESTDGQPLQENAVVAAQLQVIRGARVTLCGESDGNGLRREK